jgi:large subunit ribosomal protein L21
MTSLPAAVMATATTLPLGLLPSKTLTLSPLPSARRSLSIAAVEPRRWLLRAAAEEAPEAVEVEFVEPDAEAEEEPAVPEPVEAQLAAAGAGKDADIFAVVMVGWLPLAPPTMQLWTELLEDDMSSFMLHYL